MKEIGNIIRKKRLAMGLSRERLAMDSGVTSRCIKSIEDGSLPSLRILSKLCDVLNLRVSIEDKPRELDNDELESLVSHIAQVALNGNGTHWSHFLCDDGCEVSVKFDADVRCHVEDHYVHGTGAFIVDDCHIDILQINVDGLVIPPSKDYLKEMVETKIMEG